MKNEAESHREKCIGKTIKSINRTSNGYGWEIRLKKGPRLYFEYNAVEDEVWLRIVPQSRNSHLEFFYSKNK